VAVVGYSLLSKLPAGFVAVNSLSNIIVLFMYTGWSSTIICMSSSTIPVVISIPSGVSTITTSGTVLNSIWELAFIASCSFLSNIKRIVWYSP